MKSNTEIILGRLSFSFSRMNLLKTNNIMRETSIWMKKYLIPTIRATVHEMR